MSTGTPARELLRIIMARAAAMDDPLWFSMQADLPAVSAEQPLPDSLTLGDAALLLHVMLTLAVEGWQSREPNSWNRDQAEAYIAAMAVSRLQDLERT